MEDNDLPIPVETGSAMTVSCFADPDTTICDVLVTSVANGTLLCETGQGETPPVLRPGMAVVATYTWNQTVVSVQTTIVKSSPGTVALAWPSHHADRRRFPRAHTDRGVTIAVPGGPVVSARTLDLSAGGLRLVAGEALQAGTTIIVAFDLGTGPITAVGKVLACIPVWFEAELRIVFTTIADEHRAMIADWVGHETFQMSSPSHDPGL